EQLERFQRFSEPPDVREESAGLHRDHEPLRRDLAPANERRHLGEAIEGVVQLRRREPRGEEGEPLALWELFGVEATAPVAILPAARPDENHAPSYSPASRGRISRVLGVRSGPARPGDVWYGAAPSSQV